MSRSEKPADGGVEAAIDFIYSSKDATAMAWTAKESWRSNDIDERDT